MDEMKFDMCGAASVIRRDDGRDRSKTQNKSNYYRGSRKYAKWKGHAFWRHCQILSGKTIEILNTDAEGRLVLCDAIAYAKSFKPKAIVDVATLTGACIVALGSHASALYSNDDQLANSLESAANESGDKVWRMPLWEEYGKSKEQFCRYG